MTDLPPFADQADFADASRGFIAALTPGVVTAADGRVIWEEEIGLQLSNGALVHTRAASAPADLTVTLTKPQFLLMLATGSLDGVETTGDQGALRTLLGVLDTADSQFAMVTP